MNSITYDEEDLSESTLKFINYSTYYNSFKLSNYNFILQICENIESNEYSERLTYYLKKYKELQMTKSYSISSLHVEDIKTEYRKYVTQVYYPNPTLDQFIEINDLIKKSFHCLANIVGILLFSKFKENYIFIQKPLVSVLSNLKYKYVSANYPFLGFNKILYYDTCIVDVISFYKKFFCKFIIKIYLNQNYNLWGDTSIGIARLISDYAFNPLDEISKVVV